MALRSMLVEGVVKLLHRRRQDGKGPLPLTILADEFKALWKVPFDVRHARERDAVSFLRRYPEILVLQQVGMATFVSLADGDVDD